MNAILKLLGWDRAPEGRAQASAETESVRRIVEALDRIEPQQARYLAAYAYQLGRVAHADLKISVEETRVMERIVAERGGLPEVQAVLVVQIAKTQARLFGGTENFLVGREFEGLATHEQKLGLLDCLFSVAAADRNIGVAEENEIRRISMELHLEHRDYIAVRLKHREHLAVLRDPEAH